MIALLTAVFVASLIGSLHCAGMCGGIVSLCVSGQPIARRRAWTPHVQYNLGRLCTYMLLGATSGTAGAAIDMGGRALGWSRAAMLGAGVLMIIAGVIAMMRLAGIATGRLRLPRPLHVLIHKALAAARALPPSVRPVALGLGTGLLPCGWLYAFVVAAGGTGSTMMGAATMAAFWLGTVPILLVLGIGIDSLSSRLRRYVPTMTAVALIVVGVITIVGRMQIAPMIASPTVVDPVEYVQTLNDETPECCRDES